MKRFFSISIVLAFAFVLIAGTAMAGSVTAAWTKPTTRVDTTPLTPTELSAMLTHIYGENGSSPGSISAGAPQVGLSAAGAYSVTFTMTTVAGFDYRFGAKAEVGGVLSAMSNTSYAIAPLSAPVAPVLGTVTIN